MAQEVTVTQMTPDGVEKEFTFRGEIVNTNVFNSDNLTNLKTIQIHNNIETVTHNNNTTIFIFDKNKEEKESADNEIKLARPYQYDAYLKFTDYIQTPTTKYYKYFKYNVNDATGRVEHKDSDIHDFWLRVTHIPTVYLFIREDGTFYLIGPKKLLEDNHEILYEKYKYSFDRTESSAKFNVKPDAYIVIYYDKYNKWYKLRLAEAAEEQTIKENLKNTEWKEANKWQGGTKDVYYLEPKGILSGSTLIGKEYTKMSGLCGYINRITMDNGTGVNVAKGGNRRRTRNRKQKRKLRTAKKSM